MKLLGGVVSYEDGVKNRETETVRKVRVELDFHVEVQDEGVDVINVALDTAQRAVTSRLGISIPTNRVAALAAERPSYVESSAAPAVNDKARMAKEAGLPVKDEDIIVRAPRKPKAKPEPVQTDIEDAILETHATDTVEAIAEAEAEPDEIPDDEFLAKITHYNGQTHNALAIRELVKKYTPTDRVYQVLEVPQEKRAAFIEDLKKVPKLEKK